MSDESTDTLHRLQDFLAGQEGTAGTRIADLRRAGAGRSRENWLFDLVGPGPQDREPLILRSDPDGGLVDTSRAQEFAVLRALEASTLPTPRVRWLDATGAQLGSPSLLMRREPGTCDYRVVNGDRPETARRALAESFCDLLADVHAVDWRGLGLDDVLVDPGEQAALHELEHWEQVLRADQLEALPELDLAIDWLRTRARPARRTVLVHADYKPGNILLEGDRISSLLDWELAHLGDPLEDLGWVTQPLRAGEHLIDGAWTADDLVARYTAAFGLEVADDELRWWVVFSTFKTAVMQVSGLRAFTEGRSDEPYRPTRRVLATLLAAITED
ncbi:Predicted kinase, aminoglycoside phosphotransferase (APT) family [Klenkia soli]|uniref:Predicted kinase, aminoglycoside phosphotransferase (APT) family n=1 Tax=Klenkia soli TaxID=1052260 RepID=A0A1H0QA88_9ACTN|nr:phosphotransferase family protein [Klenkia soli]SDP13599.1 Predicted kinase, aminoglycoside phosphotransferase (APT) family [Klenkia soli]